jgi:hypothetical protein
MRIERLSLEEWASALPSSGFEPFHAPAALSVLAEHAPGELALVGGYRGEQLVAMAPLFVQRGPGVRMVSSPPPGMAVPNLGPLVMATSPKRRKQENVNGRFAEGVLDTFGVDSSRTLFRTVCHPAYGDPRPYRWNGLSVSPAFTYRLDVGNRSPDALLDSFSRSLRREIRAGADAAIEIECEGIDGGETVFRETAARYAETDQRFGVEWPYVRGLIATLDERCRVYVARTPAGEYLGGIIALYSNDAAYYWLGGTRATHEGTSVNSLLHWRIIRDVATDPPVESVGEYDLVGANTERLCAYKSKFGAELAPYYVVESGGMAMDAAKAAYDWVGRLGGRLGPG